MSDILGIPVSVLLGQLVLGLVNGSFYALLSLGLAVIFGMMRIVNFAHGAFYALGAFGALLGLQWLGLNYWVALVVSPLLVGLLGVVVERLLLRHIYGLDPLYGLLMTFGLALVIEGTLHQLFGASGRSYPVPAALTGVLLRLVRAQSFLVRLQEEGASIELRVERTIDGGEFAFALPPRLLSLLTRCGVSLLLEVRSEPRSAVRRRAS